MNLFYFFADAMEVSSLHMTFNSDVEQSTLESEGFISRLGMQYHWQNKGYQTFNDFLLDLRQSKRKTVKQVVQNHLCEVNMVTANACILKHRVLLICQCPILERYINNFARHSWTV